MTASQVVFACFSDFPMEIRLAIWRQCLPHRVVELDSQPDDIIWDEDEEMEEGDVPPCFANGMIQLRNKAPPLITRVCREARQVAFETGRQLPRFPDPQDPDNTREFAMYMVTQPWLDRARDVVHINWDPTADIEWQTYDWGDPIRCVLAYAAQTKARRASIRLGLLRAMQRRRDPDEPNEHYRWTRSELVDLMRSHVPAVSWMVVIKPPVVVHATAAAAANVAAASGLFGLLGDAPVQLVDAGEEARINEFLALAEMPGVTIRSGLELRELATARRELQDVRDAVFGSEDPAPAMHPVVMFRLCTEGCV